jgi:hypothetical protein
MGRLEPVSAEYFRDEVVRFREVMCSTSYALEQKVRAFKAIALLALNLDQADSRYEWADGIWQTTAAEWSRRYAYEAVRSSSES